MSSMTRDSASSVGENAPDIASCWNWVTGIRLVVVSAGRGELVAVVGILVATAPSTNPVSNM